MVLVILRIGLLGMVLSSTFSCVLLASSVKGQNGAKHELAQSPQIENAGLAGIFFVSSQKPGNGFVAKTMQLHGGITQSVFSKTILRDKKQRRLRIARL